MTHAQLAAVHLTAQLQVPQLAYTHHVVPQSGAVAIAAARIRRFLCQRASAACCLLSELTLLLLLQISGDAKWATGVVKENVGHVLGNEQMKADVSTCHEADCVHAVQLWACSLA